MTSGWSIVPGDQVWKSYFENNNNNNNNNNPFGLYDWFKAIGKRW